MNAGPGLDELPSLEAPAIVVPTLYPSHICRVDDIEDNSKLRRGVPGKAALGRDHFCAARECDTCAEGLSCAHIGRTSCVSRKEHPGLVLPLPTHSFPFAVARSICGLPFHVQIEGAPRVCACASERGRVYHAIFSPSSLARTRTHPFSTVQSRTAYTALRAPSTAPTTCTSSPWTAWCSSTALRRSRSSQVRVRA